jgi:CubicO group peptidase (beta-lactamase class C family)
MIPIADVARHSNIALRRFLGLLLLAAGAASATDYTPPRGSWETVAPGPAGFSAPALDAAIAYARSQAVLEPTDLRAHLLSTFGQREPDFRVLGPTGTRIQDSGMIIRGGRLVASWGDTRRPEMTFSTVKSYLGTLAGIPVAERRIADIDAPVHDEVPSGHFTGSHNGAITWRHLLQQTSDWSGTLWDIADWADRPEGDDSAAWPLRLLHTPGTRYKYNDVRVNLLAYALLQVQREPLPQLLRTRIMDPIGASSSWRWYGYDTSWIELDGQRLQSVSGGGHFGGGMFINTEDHARFGLLMLRRGNWNGQRLVEEDWIDAMRQPSAQKPDYGFLWWLNTDRAQLPAAPASAYYAAGNGGNYIYIDEEHDLVVVLRWIPDLAGVIERILGALDV